MTARPRWTALLALTLIAACLPSGPPAPPEASVVYLVRHAEKAADDPVDPTLSAEGLARVDALTHVLSGAELTDVYSTSYRRTLATVEPLAQAAGVEIQPYDPTDTDGMVALIEHLRTTPGRHLVVGHSNTTPGLVMALGGDPVSAIADDEYDRLYVVVVGPDGTATSMLLRYGAPGG